MLLVRAFGRDLERWLTRAYGREVTDAISFGRSVEDYAHNAVDLLWRHGRIDSNFFVNLAKARPFRADEISSVAMQWGFEFHVVTGATAPIGGGARLVGLIIGLVVLAWLGGVWWQRLQVAGSAKVMAQDCVTPASCPNLMAEVLSTIVAVNDHDPHFRIKYPVERWTIAAKSLNFAGAIVGRPGNDLLGAALDVDVETIFLSHKSAVSAKLITYDIHWLSSSVDRAHTIYTTNGTWKDPVPPPMACIRRTAQGWAWQEWQYQDISNAASGFKGYNATVVLAPASDERVACLVTYEANSNDEFLGAQLMNASNTTGGDTLHVRVGSTARMSDFYPLERVPIVRSGSNPQDFRVPVAGTSLVYPKRIVEQEPILDSTPTELLSAFKDLTDSNCSSHSCASVAGLCGGMGIGEQCRGEFPPSFSWIRPGCPQTDGVCRLPNHTSGPDSRVLDYILILDARR